jgi:hypothetical protein
MAATGQHCKMNIAIIQCIDLYEVAAVDILVFTMVDTLLIEEWCKMQGIHSTI